MGNTGNKQGNKNQQVTISSTVLDQLPKNVKTKVLSFLAPEYLPVRVCQNWEQIIADADLWHLYWQRYFPKSYAALKNKSDANRKAFLAQYTKLDLRRKLLNLVKGLHTLGYPATLQCGYSPSGCYYRATLNIGSKTITDSFGGGTRLFEIDNVLDMTDIQLAKALIKRFGIQRCGTEKEAADWIKWHKNVMSKLSRWDFYYEFADWYYKPEGLPVECNCEVPCVVPKDLPFYERKK